MPRKGPAPKRPVVADPVYGSPVVSQLVNKILLDGKKGLAEGKVEWKRRDSKDVQLVPIEDVLNRAIEAVKG